MTSRRVLWLFVWLLYVYSLTTVINGTENESESEETQYDYLNRLGHEYEAGEDGVDHVQCADEFEDLGKNECIIMYICAYVLVLTLVLILMHTCIHAYIHTHTCSYIPII